MKLPSKSTDQEIDIKDLYAVKIGAIWKQLTREHFAFWALCGYFFFEYVRPQSIYTEIDVLPWPQLFFIVAFAGAFLDPSVKWVGNIANKLIIAFFLVILASSAFAEIPQNSWDRMSLFLNWFLVYFLVITIVNSEKRFFIFFLALLLYNYKMSQHGFFSWSSRGFAFTSWGLKGTPGWFSNSGEFAIEMLIFLPMGAAFALGLREYWGPIKRWFFYLMPVTAVFSIIGSSSRGAQIALALLAIWAVLRSKARVRALIAIALCAWALHSFMPAEQMARFESMGEDRTSLQRFVYWEYGLKIMNENPVFGIGYFNWLGYLEIHEPNGMGPMMAKELPHNIFIQVGAELGYSGLIIVLAMILTIFLLNGSTRRMAAKSGNKFIGSTAFALDVGLFGFLVAGFFVTVFYYPFFWVQLALTVTLYSIAKQQEALSENAVQQEAEENPQEELPSKAGMSR